MAARATAGTGDDAETGLAAEAAGPLTRGLAVLEAVAESAEPVRPADLAKTTALARSAVDRLDATLVHLGYLRSEGRDLVAAPRLMEFGNAYLQAAGLPEAVQPHLDRLAGAVDESVSLIAADGCDMRIVARAIPPGRVIPLGFRVGDLLPADRCAAGAVLAHDWTPEQHSAWRERRIADPVDAGYPALPPRPAAVADPAGTERAFAAWIAEASEQGWALDDQIAAPGLVALAVPVSDRDGVPRYALSVLAHTSRSSADGLRENFLERLTASARDMGDALAGATDPAEPSVPSPYTDAKAELGPLFLQALARGLAVLTALGARRGGLTLNEAAQATGLSYPSTRRNLLTLRHLGYAEQRGRRYLPAARTLGLGHARLSGLSLTDIARPHLAELATRVHESASVAVLDGAEVRYLARSATRQVTSAGIQPGTRLPAYATSMGRVLLADLPPREQERLLSTLPPRPLTPLTRTSPVDLAGILRRTREDGHAMVEQELEVGLRSMAVPLRDPRGTVVAAVNVAVHAGPDTPEQSRERLLPHLHATAHAIEADLAAVFAFAEVRVE
ncbi:MULTISPECIES: IclR family transcriptional regulator domain-containing protein [Streptomyces]|uniref:IclR family transcriptional regulator domain-containing protein n=1 Tax=Streptomyces herbicida TaxID=3065675 RepID=UPI00292F3AC4|nr:IclR family transcriptional regulator C-terminal domain-containing protein [Streptomyces sp. NEAU-HV9]